MLRFFFHEKAIKYLQTSLWSNLHPNQVIGTAATIKEIDCSTATVNDILKIRSSVCSKITGERSRLAGFSGWFDVHFRVRRALMNLLMISCLDFHVSIMWRP